MNADKIRGPEPAQIFAEYLRRTRRRNTPERTMILETALSMKGHFSIESLCSRLESSGHRVSVATVYNNVRLLVDCGILLADSFGSRILYEAASGSHTHAVCTSCGKVRDIRIPGLEQQIRALRIASFAPSQYSINVYGICSSCARKRKAAKTIKKESKNKPK